MSDLTILCKVVDNFGDIGFVYRLAKNLCKVNPSYQIRIITNDLKTFKMLAPELGNGGANIALFDSNDAVTCRAEFCQRPPRVILECFQCGRPDWLEEILFCDTKIESKPKTSAANGLQDQEPRAFIINIDYLTAEDYAEGFHKLKSGTRSAFVKKINFMPGFTAKTGGLILDVPAETDSKTKTAGPQVLMFSYPKDFAPIIRAISRWNKDAQINLAQGAGKESFLSAKNAGDLKINQIPFLSQEEWDKNLFAQDLLFVRGEDSLSRACLASKPFVWQAYLQDDNYQLVKVQALLERMRPHFAAADFCAVENFWHLYNGAPGCQDPSAMETACYEFLSRYDNLRPGFAAFSQSLFELGNFSQKLDEFVAEWAN
ncbi:MAG: elongation factor P maturation arginine rhamnosyltransferase EarP [Treponema sp.]|nr:elongation factor P maturation arginine rhamnosyltransferase EarP [Treponema sp.]